MYSHDGKIIKFKRASGDREGMMYVDLSKTESGAMIVQIVRTYFEGYTKQKAEKAKLVRELQGMVGNKYLVVVLQLLGTSCSCYNNNYITKLWDPALTFSIYT